MRRAARALVVACLLALAVAPPASAQPASARVQVIDFQYTPSAATIAVGGTVEWVWEGSSQHTVTARDASFDEMRERNGRFAFVFRTAGRYEYFCRIHDVMVGTVTVQAGTTAPASPTPAPTTARPAPSPTTARPSPSASPPATPSPLPSPTSAAPSPTPSPSASRSAAASPSSASPGRSVVPPTESRSPAPLVTLDEPRPKDRTGLAIALALVVAAGGFGLGATLLLRGRPRRLPVEPE